MGGCNPLRSAVENAERPVHGRAACPVDSTFSTALATIVLVETFRVVFRCTVLTNAVLGDHGHAIEIDHRRGARGHRSQGRTGTR